MLNVKEFGGHFPPTRREFALPCMFGIRNGQKRVAGESGGFPGKWAGTSDNERERRNAVGNLH